MFFPILHKSELFWVNCGRLLVFSAISRFCTVIGLELGNFWVYSWLVPDQSELGISNSIPS